MTDIAGNILNLRKNLPQPVKIVAVSKTKPPADILVAYNNGQRCFGENRVQELMGKKDMLPADIEWHLIGHLQTNKVKYIVPFIGMIQSVDSFRLLKIINSEAAKINRMVNCLLQIYIATEETKFGFDTEELGMMLASQEYQGLNNIKICGVMGMASLSDNSMLVRSELAFLRKCFNDLKERFFLNNNDFREISMGMSGDFEIAVAEGSTMVRIGSIIFGGR
jgi:pyridoxal phosphate enzyme (YggS family)